MTRAAWLQAVKKSYDGRVVVDVDELAVGAGEVIAVSGPNGAGKSTLIRLMSLVEETDPGGTIEILGERPVGRRRVEARRRLAVVFQEPFVYRGTVYDNIALGLRWRGLPAAETRRRVESMADLLQLEGLDRVAGKLSRGQVQRLALARALALEPELLLLDEPLSALDAEIRETLLTDTVAWLRRDTHSVVYVTHSGEEAGRLADRHLEMKAGVLR